MDSATRLPKPRRSETVAAVLLPPQTAVFVYISNTEKLLEWATDFERELEGDGQDLQGRQLARRVRYEIIAGRL